MNAEVVRRQPDSSFPTLARDRIPAGDRGITHEVDEDQSGIGPVQFPQEEEMRQPVGVLVEAVRPVRRRPDSQERPGLFQRLFDLGEGLSSGTGWISVELRDVRLIPFQSERVA